MAQVKTRIHWGSTAGINVTEIPNPGDAEEITVSWDGTQLLQTNDPNDPALHNLSAGYANTNTYTLDVGVTYDGTPAPRHFVNGDITADPGATESYDLPQT